MRKCGVRWLMSVLLMIVLLAGCSSGGGQIPVSSTGGDGQDKATESKAEATPLKVDAIAGTVGGVWYIGFGAIAKAIVDDYPGSNVNLIAGGSSGNPLRLNKGEGDLSITQHTMAVAGARGQEPYQEKMTNVRSILNISDVTRLNIVVRADLPIRSIEDIKENKPSLRLAPGPKGTVSELFGGWAFAEYGIALTDIQTWGGKLFYGNYNEVAQQMRDGHLDAFFWTGPGEAAFIQDITSSVKVRWLPVSASVLKVLGEKYGLASGTVPAGYYAGSVDQDTATAVDSTELIVRADMPDDMAYSIVKSVLDHRADITLAYNTWKSITPETAPLNLGFPLHPGAERYYKEKGLLK